MKRYRANTWEGKRHVVLNSNIEGYALPTYGETETEIEGQRGTRTKK